jgi:hypothetical protein
VRYFGTEPEVRQYKDDVSSRLKVKFEKPPVQEFVSIETYQNLVEGTCELKMPKYFEKAKHFFQDFRKGSFKERTIPLSVLDEKCLFEQPTPEEIEEAKGLPYLQAVGILSYPASNCKFEMRYAISVLGSRRSGWSKKHFEIAVKLFEYALTTKEIGLMYSKGLDPHGDNIIYAYGDASLRLPRPQGCRIVMMNGAAISFVSKMQTLTAPSSTWAESVTLFDCSTDVMGIRNLLSELGHLQDSPTTIYQDNKSTIQIANNRGSLGKSSRAMDLKTLSTRNRIEDHDVETKWLETKEMLGDMGSKALPENPFVRFRDSMNGYALVRAKFPRKVLSPFVYNPQSANSSLESVQAMIMGFNFHDDKSNTQQHSDEEDWEDAADDDDGMETEEEEDIDDGDDMNLDDEEAEPGPMPELQIPNGDDEISLTVQNPSLFVSTESEIILTIPKLVFNDDWFEFNHHWSFHRLYPTERYGLFELDDLPDPRLYGINVRQLRALARRQCDECGGPFDPTFEAYLIHVEPVHLTTTMMDNYITNYDLIVENNVKNMLNRSFKKPNPMKFFPSMLHNDPVTRRLQINRALNKFVILLDVHIEGKTWYDTLDNVYWGIGTGDPSPKLSWLRFIRWRRYFLHLKLSGITTTEPDPEMIQLGPPNLRAWDKERMALTNCFALSTETGQFASNSVGCHSASNPESPFPRFPNVCDDSIILYQYKSIWTMDLNDYDCNTKWNFSFSLYKQPFLGKLPFSLRQDKLLRFIDNRFAEWGSKSNFATAMEGSSDNNGEEWLMSNVYQESQAENANNGWQVDRPAKQQKLDKDEV